MRGTAPSSTAASRQTSPEPVAEFHLDRNVAADVADELAVRGHVVVPTTLGHNAPDYAHLLRAAQVQAILLTHNGRDFTLLHGAWQRWPPALGVLGWQPHAGILVPPRTPQWPPARIAQTIDALLGTGVRLTNTLYEWRPSTGWREWVLPPA